MVKGEKKQLAEKQEKEYRKVEICSKIVKAAEIN